VFHFYEKNREFVRCEISEVSSGKWHIVVTEPNGYARTEQFTSSAQAHERWKQLGSRFAHDGWFGPYGRE
jgi:hypothetical protein